MMINNGELLKLLLPVIIGALISIIPNMLNKNLEHKTKKLEENRIIKLNNYVDFINLVTIIMKNPGHQIGFEPLISKINTVNMIGSAQVVKTLNDYLQTWGKGDNQDEQNEQYFKLLVEMRRDLGIDNGDLLKYNTIGLIDVVRNDKNK